MGLSLASPRIRGLREKVLGRRNAMRRDLSPRTAGMNLNSRPTAVKLHVFRIRVEVDLATVSRSPAIWAQARTPGGRRCNDSSLGQRALVPSRVISPLLPVSKERRQQLLDRVVSKHILAKKVVRGSAPALGLRSGRVGVRSKRPACFWYWTNT